MFRIDYIPREVLINQPGTSGRDTKQIMVTLTESVQYTSEISNKSKDQTDWKQIKLRIDKNTIKADPISRHA